MVILIVSTFTPYPSCNADCRDGHGKDQRYPVSESATMGGLSARAPVLIVRRRHLLGEIDHRMRPLAVFRRGGRRKKKRLQTVK